MKKAKIYSILCISMFITFAIFTVLPISTLALPNGDDYPYNDYETDENTENYDSSHALGGTGFFSSLDSGVGQQYKGVVGTRTEEWDATLPLTYQYGEADISLIPESYSRNYNAGSATQSSSSWTSIGHGTGFEKTNIEIVPTSWNMWSTYGASGLATESDDTYGQNTNAPAGWYNWWSYRGESTNSRYYDGIWASSSSQHAVDVIAAGVDATVWWPGVSTWTKANIYITDTLNIPIDPSWTVKSITIDLGMAGNVYQGTCVGAGHNAEGYLKIDANVGSDHTLDSGSMTTHTNQMNAIYFSDVIGGSWEYYAHSVPGTTYRFGRISKTYTINKNIESINYVNGQAKFRYEFYVYAWDNFVWNVAASKIALTEFDVQYNLEWNGGSGSFSGGKKMYETQYQRWTDDTWVSGSTPPLSNGIINEPLDYDDRVKDLRIRTVLDSQIESISMNYNLKYDLWSFSYGSITDVVLQWHDGTSWIDFDSLEWSIHSDNLNDEDWYVNGVGIKFKIRVISYAGSVNGISFRYEIDYGDILLIEPAHTIGFSGDTVFTQASGRYIDETWTNFYMYDTPSIASITKGATSLQFTQTFSMYDGTTPLYDIDSSYTESYWDGDQLETMTISWTTDNDIPTIIDFLRVNETIEYESTLFNITCQDSTSGIDSCYVIFNDNQTNENNTFTLTQNDGDSYYDELSIPIGNYSYWYLVMDGAGNWKTTERIPLNVSQSNVYIWDVSAPSHEVSTQNVNITFEVGGNADGYWELNISDSQFANGSWFYPQDFIKVNISGLSIGIYDFSLFANNSLGWNASYSGQFTVYQTPIITDAPTNTTIIECGDNYIVSWIATDENPSSYVLYLDGVPVQTQTWTSSEVITHEVNPNELQQNIEHVYEMVFMDQHGVFDVDYYGITVIPSLPIISDETGGDMGEDEIVSVSWTVSDHCNDYFVIEYYDSLFGWLKYYEANLSRVLFTQEATVLVDGQDFALDTHTLRCTVYDKSANTAMDELIFTVWKHPPRLSDSPDGTYYADDRTAQLTWEVEDATLKSYTIMLKTSTGYDTLDSGNLTDYKEEIVFNLYQAQLPEGVSEIIIFVEDMDGNIVNDTIRAENLGLEPAIELNVSGLTMWLITIFLGAMAGYMLVKTDMWERANEQKKRYVKFGIAGVVIGILTILSIFGQFPATFTKLNEIIATAESSIQGYGLLITIVGVSVGSLAGVGLIYWGLKRRNMI